MGGWGGSADCNGGGTSDLMRAGKVESIKAKCWLGVITLVFSGVIEWDANSPKNVFRRGAFVPLEEPIKCI